MAPDSKGVHWTGCGCVVMLVLLVAGVLALGAWKKHASCEWAKQHDPQHASEVCR